MKFGLFPSAVKGSGCLLWMDGGRGWFNVRGEGDSFTVFLGCCLIV